MQLFEIFLATVFCLEIRALSSHSTQTAKHHVVLRKKGGSRSRSVFPSSSGVFAASQKVKTRYRRANDTTRERASERGMLACSEEEGE